MASFETTTYVDVSLKDFDTDELIDELADRGEMVSKDIGSFDDNELFAEVEARGRFVTKNLTDFTKSEIDLLLSMIPVDYKIGSDVYFIREKLFQGKMYAKN
jgi:hypothetical protein